MGGGGESKLRVLIFCHWFANMTLKKHADMEYGISQQLNEFH
jgi:hypothetical protein